MNRTEMLAALARWRTAGWLRSLDVALADFIAETAPAAPASLLLAVALVAHLEGRGHSGLPLRELPSGRDDVLDWPPEAQAELDEAFRGWPADASAWRDAWRDLSVIELDPVDGKGASPMVLSGDLLYLRRYWRHESRVAAQVCARVAGDDVSADLSHGIDVAAARALLDRLFATRDHSAGTDWQKVACALALRGRLTLITGGPGTGKTYTAARLLVALQALHAGPQPLRVALAAPTGKAAARLRQSISKALQQLRETLDPALPLDDWARQLASARTLHSLLGVQPGTRRFRHDASNTLEVDVLFVDEASMVHLEMMAQLLEALPATSRVVLLGDKDQLASVEAGAVMGDLCQGAGAGGVEAGYRPETAAWVQALTGRELPADNLGAGPPLAQQTALLTESRRFDGPIGQLALAINQGDADRALTLLRQGVAVDGPVTIVQAPQATAALPLALRGRAGAAGGYATYLELLAHRPASSSDVAFDDWAKSVLRAFDRFRVLCAVREGAWGVSGLNDAIERALVEAGLLVHGSEWFEGRPVMVTRNSMSLGIFNGDIGIVLRPLSVGAALRAYFLDGDDLRSVSVSRLADVETAFAMTVHKSQGSEFEHVVLVLPDDDVPVLTRELFYTGVTRASMAFTLVVKATEQIALATGRLTRRVSGLRRML